MKSQTDFLSTNETISSSQTDLLVICPGQNEALQFCLNQNCTQNDLFTCWTKGCECQTKHGLCKRGSIESCIQVIKSKIKNTDEIKDRIEKILEKIIDQLSDFRDNLIKQVQANMKYGMLHEVQHKFLKISEKKSDSKELTPKQASLLWDLVTGRLQNKTNKFEQLEKKLNNLEGKTVKQIIKTRKQIEQMMSSLDFKMEKRSSKLLQQLIYESSICNSSQLQQKLQKMFSQKVKRFQLIFQASSHSFNINKYKELCGRVQNTVVIALTSRGKIFGGYSPFCFYNGNNQWVTDPQKRSFLFSLSQNAKFELQNSNKAIYRYADGSLIRFGSDFYIYNGANKNMCLVGYQNSYKNEDYIHCSDSYLKLNGNINENCTLKEWEVFRVEFQENPQSN